MDVNPFSPAHEAITEARNLLAGVMDTDIRQGAVLAACDAYNSLETANPGVWPPPQPCPVDDPEVALQRVHALIRHALDRARPPLNSYRLGTALRETAAAIVMLHRPGGAA